jgi:Flp pilus assembly protein TadG
MNVSKPVCNDPRPNRQRPQRRRGQSLVELAVLMPLLALIMLGAIDFSRVFIGYTRLTNVVREGAYFGSKYPGNTAGIQDRAYREANDQLGTNNVDIIVNTTTDIRCYQGLTTTLIASTTPGDCTAVDASGNSIAHAGDSIEVTAHYVFRPFTTQIIRLLPANYQVKKSARMVIQ